MLDALDQGRTLFPEQIARLTGVDIRTAFADTFARAEELGIFVTDGDRIQVVDEEGREELIDRLVPRGAAAKSLPVIRSLPVEPELIPEPRDEAEEERGRAILREFCETLQIPTRGHQVCRGVWVGQRHGATMEFHIGAPKAAPLRVFVASPDSTPHALFSTDRFAVSFGSEGSNQPSRLERRFLAWLRARAFELDRGAVTRA